VRKWNTGTAETNSAAFIENIDFPMTREYVEAVKKKYEAYREKLE
jgi:soluble lytic murein transglycosylase-like protein